MERTRTSTLKDKCEIIGIANIRPKLGIFSRKREAVLFRYKALVYAMDENGKIMGRVMDPNPIPGGTYWLNKKRANLPSSGLRADIEKEYAGLRRTRYEQQAMAFRGFKPQTGE